MSFSRHLFLIALFVTPGCAQGGGDMIDAGTGGVDAGAMVDSGSMGFDAGPMGFDAGPMGGDDAGPMGTDSGPMGSDAGPMGTDAGPMGSDAGFDAGPPPMCTVASDCDDTLNCNGAERCIGGRCQAGTAFSCDDGILCTRDTCVEGATPTCNFAPDNALCPAGSTCTGTGCMAMCADTPCRLVDPQCGCPSGQGCYLSGSSRLCTTAGRSAPGTTCSGLFSCVPGNICINVARSGTPANMCNRFCNSDAECGGGICFYTLNDGMGGSVPGVTICTNPCDPIARTGCPTGTACTILREPMGAMRFFADCTAPVGAGGQGATCTGQEDCQAGFACLGTPGECLRWCDAPGLPGTIGGCGILETCFGLTTPIVIGGTSYGVCDT